MDLNELKSGLESFNPNLLKHSLGTMDEAEKLAIYYKASVEKARVAGLLHDLGKRTTKELDNLTHAKLSSELAYDIFNIKDKEILNAIMYHTTGRENMTLLDKIIFIADKIEPSRKYEGVDKLRKIAYENIDNAIIMSIESTVAYVKSRNLELDNESIKTLKFLKETI